MMIFKEKKHKDNLYNILLSLSRNIFFYDKIKLLDTFETRIYLMFMHFSIMLIVSKKKGKKFDQKTYDLLFHNIENNLRELGFGDVSVNKKMKDFNKILYDILLKIDIQSDSDKIAINNKLIKGYFKEFNDAKNPKYLEFESYLTNFYHFCFDQPLESMVRNTINFKF